MQSIFPSLVTEEIIVIVVGFGTENNRGNIEDDNDGGDIEDNGGGKFEVDEGGDFKL